MFFHRFLDPAACCLSSVVCLLSSSSSTMFIRWPAAASEFESPHMRTGKRQRDLAHLYVSRLQQNYGSHGPGCSTIRVAWNIPDHVTHSSAAAG